jgi:hypothetical protein
VITQGIANWWAEVVATLLLFIPPLPDAWVTSLGKISDGGAALARQVSFFGPIAPFDQMSIMLSIWSTLLGLWLGAIGVRAVLKGLGR